MVRDRASHASAVGLGWHPFQVGNALTEEDVNVHSHNQNCKHDAELHKMTQATVARSGDRATTSVVVAPGCGTVSRPCHNCVRSRKSKGLAAEARKPL